MGEWWFGGGGTWPSVPPQQACPLKSIIKPFNFLHTLKHIFYIRSSTTIPVKKQCSCPAEPLEGAILTLRVVETQQFFFVIIIIIFFCFGYKKNAMVTSSSLDESNCSESTRKHSENPELSTHWFTEVLKRWMKTCHFARWLAACPDLPGFTSSFSFLQHTRFSWYCSWFKK